MSEHLPQQPETTFHFVLCEHTVENAAMIAASLWDCDIIAFESVGSTQSEKDRLAVHLNTYLSSDTSAETRGRIEEAVRGSEVEFDIAVLKAFPASDKKAVLIDASEEDAVYESVDVVDAVQEKYVDMLFDGASVKDLSAVLEANIAQFGENNAVREAIIVEQLKVLAAANPESKVGVVLGAGHSPVQHRINELFQTDRRFVGTRELQPLESYNYDLKTQAVRNARFGIAKEAGNQVLRRLLLRNLYQVNHPEGLSEVDIRKLSPEGVEILLTKMDDIQAQKREVSAAIRERSSDMTK